MITDPGLKYDQIELAGLFAFGLVGDSLTDLNNQDYYYDGNHYSPVNRATWHYRLKMRFNCKDP
jgi:hypothetical protein